MEDLYIGMFLIYRYKNPHNQDYEFEIGIIEEIQNNNILIHWPDLNKSMMHCFNFIKRHCTDFKHIQFDLDISKLLE